MEKTLENRLSKEIIKVAASHHERFDASGYPRGLKGSAMGTKEAILQISEQVVNAMEPKPYRDAHTRHWKYFIVSTIVFLRTNMMVL